MTRILNVTEIKILNVTEIKKTLKKQGLGGVTNGARTHDPQNHNLML